MVADAPAIQTDKENEMTTKQMADDADEAAVVVGEPAVAYLRVSGRKQLDTDFGEDGLSLPDQRRECGAYASGHGLVIADEYVERAETGTNTDRPALRALLERVAERRDVKVVVVHKIDRIARNAEDYYALRARLRSHGVRLASVAEPIDTTPPGRLMEGFLAAVNEYYSANLSHEVRKGMGQKARNGGWPHQAPVGYRNTRIDVEDRKVAVIVPDPERAPLITRGFELYATGEWTLEALDEETYRAGLRNKRGNRVGVNGWARILARPVYAGVVTWEGVEYDGIHEPLVDRATYERVQQVLASRAMRGTRERRHPHHLKGVLHCGVCGRRLAVMVAKGRYRYFYCLGQNTRKRTGCREPYVPTDVLEAEVENLYERLALPEDLANELANAIAAEIDARQSRSQKDRTRLQRRRVKVEKQRKKLLDTYYADAIDIGILKTEQQRLGVELSAIDEHLAALDTGAAEWRNVLDVALRFATDCHTAYRSASGRTKQRFNTAVFERLDVRNGRITDQCKAPFDLLFNAPKFQLAHLVDLTGLEPVTPCMPCKCSTRLSYRPW